MVRAVECPLDDDRHPLNTVIRAGFHLALVLAAVALLLGPIHAQFVERADIVDVHGANQFSVALSDQQTLEPQQTVKVYRFNPGWARPIGEATVVSTEQGQARLQFDPATFAWPLGIQGRVLNLRDNMAQINLGLSLIHISEPTRRS